MSNVKSLPSDKDVYFILCEDVRPESDGKITILGMIPGTKVGFLPNSGVAEGEALVGSLTLLMVFRDGIGQYEALMSLLSPAGVELLSPQSQTVDKPSPEGAMNIVVALRPLVAAAGTYTFSVSLDGHRYTRTFEVAMLPGKK